MHTPSNPPTATQRLAARLILDHTPGTAAVAIAKHAAGCPACDGHSKCRCTPELFMHSAEDQGGWLKTFAAIACNTPPPRRAKEDEERKVVHTTHLQGGKILTVIRYPERGRLERAIEGPFITGEGLEPSDSEMFQFIGDCYQCQADERGERLAIYWQMERGQNLRMTFEPRRATSQTDKPAPVSRFAVLDDFIAEMRQSIREALSKKTPAQLVAHFERFPADFIFCITP